MRLSNKILVAIGNKARHGKDTFANLWKELDPIDVYITHWADPLKEEVANVERKLPLVYRTKIDGKLYYSLLHTKVPHYTYIIKTKEEVPYLHKIFEERGIETYAGMNEKDSEMLQFWGTDFRRAHYTNYWVDIILKEIAVRPEKYILIPDTRFTNEYNAVKDRGGVYVQMQRLNEDGSLYLDPMRDPKHKSEIDLDWVVGDFVITAKGGNMQMFTTLSLMTINGIKKGYF